MMGSLLGEKDSKRLLEDLPNKIVNYLGIVADVNLVKRDDKSVIEINVVPSSVPISFKGAYYYRSGSTMQELKGASLQQFILRKIGKTWDDLPCINAALDDIDPEAIHYFFSKADKQNRVAENIREDELQLTLQNLDLVTDDGYLKNAALLLFGKRPTKFFPSVEFKIGRFVRNDADLIFQDVISGNIIQMADKVMDILRSKYLISPIHYEGLQRIEMLEMPEDALREAIFNAIIHKDYTGVAIQLSVYNDKIMLWNEGSLPEGWNIERLLEKHPSRPANRNIASIFFKAGFIEAWGRGISKITDGFVNYNLLKPVFEDAFGGLMVTMFRKEGIIADKDTEKVGEKVGEKLTDNQQAIIDFINQDHYASAKRIAEYVGISARKVEENIAKLKKTGIIERIGPAKGGYWQVIKDSNPKN